MRKLSLKTYVTYYLKKLSKDNTLSVKKLDEEMNSNNVRLYVPLFVYCVVTNKNVNKNSKLFNELNRYFECYSSEEQELLKYLKNTNEYEHVRFVEAFESENNWRDSTRIKERLREYFQKFAKEKQCSYTKMAKLAGIQPNHFCSFMIHEEYNKVSVKKLRQLRDVIVDSKNK